MGRNFTVFVIPNGKNLLKEKLHSGSLFKCNDKGWVTELKFESLRKVWDRRPSAVLEKEEGWF
jgi:hypothetical protein